MHRSFVPLKHAAICFAVLTFAVGLVLPSASAAYTIVASDIVDDNGSWTIGILDQPFITGSGGGISPTAGTDVMHFNNFSAGSTGTNSIEFSGVLLAVGDYLVTIDAGNFNNQPMITLDDIGMTAGGTLLAPTSSSVPTPGLGQIEEWIFLYSIGAGDPLLGQDIGFSITAPFTGDFFNGSFDNLSIQYQVPEPGTALLLGSGLLGFAAFGRRRR